MKISLFPLNVVLLPNEEISLHIFEPRYKKLIGNCLDNNNDFGIIFKNKSVKHNVGCTAKIIDVLYEYETGEYDIIVKGDKKFNLKNIHKENDLWVGEVIVVNDILENTNKSLVKKVQNNYINILLNHKITKDIDLELNRKISYDFTKKIILPLKLKQMFLELPNETQRLFFLDELFEKVIKTKATKDADDLN